MTAVMLESALTCPECGHVKKETMPTDACQWFYECEHCGVVLRPKPGGLLRVLLIRQRSLPAHSDGLAGRGLLLCG